MFVAGPSHTRGVHGHGHWCWWIPGMNSTPTSVRDSPPCDVACHGPAPLMGAVAVRSHAWAVVAPWAHFSAAQKGGPSAGIPRSSPRGDAVSSPHPFRHSSAPTIRRRQTWRGPWRKERGVGLPSRVCVLVGTQSQSIVWPWLSFTTIPRPTANMGFIPQSQSLVWRRSYLRNVMIKSKENFC